MDHRPAGGWWCAARRLIGQPVVHTWAPWITACHPSRPGSIGGVIAEVQQAVRGLLTPLLPPDCELAFDAPASLSFVLAAVGEDVQGSETDWTDIRSPEGRVVGRRPPVRRFDLTYAVSIAPESPALIDAVLIAVDPGKRLPVQLLAASLAGHPITVRLGDQSLLPMSPLAFPPQPTVLAVVVNAPLVLPVVTEIAAPAERIRLGVAPPGRAAPASTGQPAPVSSRGGPEPVPASGQNGRWQSAAVEEEADAVRGQDE